ncbi:hypothetical protein Tco_1504277 [Tanacetum coccineum]
MHSLFLRQTSQELLIYVFLRNNFTMSSKLTNSLLKLHKFAKHSVLDATSKAINRVLLTFNSSLLCAFSSTLVGGKLLKTLSLDESRSHEFNLFSDLEEYSKEEVAETMVETMEQYMTKTQADYGSGIHRPKIDNEYSFELKG